MKTDIILSGVGGQGILTIATVIGQAALDSGLAIKQAEVHGMSQRGGDVQSHLRISSGPIFSDLIPRGGADAILSLEPMEALRYLPYLAHGGWIVTSSAPFVNIPNYPDAGAIHAELLAQPRLVMLDVDAIAREAGSVRAANIVLLGAASVALEIGYGKLEGALRKVFAPKGEAVVEANVRALEAGRKAAMEMIKTKNQ